MSFVIIVWNSEDLEIFIFIFSFVCFLFLFLFFIFVFYFIFVFCFLFFFFLEVKTWKVKCYSLPFFLLPICNGKNLHSIKHTKWIKQGQDCQKVIAKISFKIYIKIFIYHHCFFSLWFARFLQYLKHVILKYEIM